MYLIILRLTKGEDMHHF